MHITRMVTAGLLASLALGSTALASDNPGKGSQDRPGKAEARAEARHDAEFRRPDWKEGPGAVRTDIKARLDGIREAFQMNGASLQGVLEERKGDIRELLGDRREEAKALIEARRAEFEEQLEARKDGMRKKLEVRKAELRAKLGIVKDERKREAVLRVDAALDAINESRVSFFTKTTDRIEAVLDAVESRADKAEADGKEVAAVRVRIETATDAIGAARAAIVVQAGNAYDPAVSAEDELKADLAAARDALKEDLVALRAKVVAAHEAVRAAASALKEVPGIDAIGFSASSTVSVSSSTR